MGMDWVGFEPCGYAGSTKGILVQSGLKGL